MGRVFIGQFVSEKESLLDKRISQAGNNYQLKFIKMVNPDISISIVPIFFDADLISEVDEKTYKLTSKKRNRIRTILGSNFKAFSIVKNNKEVENVWMYNITTSTVLLSVLLTLFTRKKLFFIVADYHYSSKIFRRIISIILSLSKGCIVLNNNIKTNINTKVEVFPGIINTSSIITNNNNANKNILFSGSLGKTTGFELALKMAKQMKDYTLYITGRPYGYTDVEFERVLKEYEAENIKYLGLLDYKEYVDVIKKCTIALSLRDPKDVQHDYNFPSKILEYMSNGMVVISTKIYVEIDNKSYFSTDEYSVEGLSKVVRAIFDIEDLLTYRAYVSKYVKDNFTVRNLLDKVEKLEN